MVSKSNGVILQINKMPFPAMTNLTGKTRKVTTSNEILEYLIPLTDEQKLQLERNILEEGCREPLIVWPNNKGQMVLIDGHNRLKICQKHGLTYKIGNSGVGDHFFSRPCNNLNCLVMSAYNWSPSDGKNGS